MINFYKWLFIYALFAQIILANEVLFSQYSFDIHYIKSYNNSPRGVVEYENGYLVVGENKTGFALGNGFLLMLDKQGNVVWEKLINSYGENNYEYFTTVVYDKSDQVFYVGGVKWIDGRTKQMNRIIKLDVNGTIIWDKLIGSEPVLAEDNNLHSILLTDSGILIGTTVFDSLSQTTNAELIELDTAGAIVWRNNYGTDDQSVNDRIDWMWKIDALADGYLTFIKSADIYGYVFYNLLKTDFNGNEIWKKEITNYQSESLPGDSVLYFMDFAVFHSTHYITAFETKEDVVNQVVGDLVLMEFDGDGNELNYRKYSQENGMANLDIHVNESQEVFLTGSTEVPAPYYFQLYAAKFSEEKDKIWDHNYGYQDINDLYSCGIYTMDGGVFIGGSAINQQIAVNMLGSELIKTDCAGNTNWDYQACISDNNAYILTFPNPFNEFITIQLPIVSENITLHVEFYDASGKLVVKQNFYNTKIVTINTDKFAKGLYSFRLWVNGTYYDSGKLIKE